MSEPTRAEWRDWAAGIEKPEPKTFREFMLMLSGMSLTQARWAIEVEELQAKLIRQHQIQANQGLGCEYFQRLFG